MGAKKTEPGMLKNREIYCVDLLRERADELLPTLREQGRNPRVYKRLVRAEGIDMVGYVVVVDTKVSKSS